MVAMTSRALGHRVHARNIRRRLRVRVTNGAAVGPRVGKKLVVRFEARALGTLAKQLGFPTMALAAHKGNGLDPRRPGAVIAMAVVARGGRKILAIEQCRGVDALSPTIVLIDG